MQTSLQNKGPGIGIWGDIVRFSNSWCSNEAALWLKVDIVHLCVTGGLSNGLSAHARCQGGVRRFKGETISLEAQVAAQHFC
jgi:hypothetical protein